jgi:hypothetical protein
MWRRRFPASILQLEIKFRKVLYHTLWQTLSGTLKIFSTKKIGGRNAFFAQIKAIWAGKDVLVLLF